MRRVGDCFLREKWSENSEKVEKGCSWDLSICKWKVLAVYYVLFVYGFGEVEGVQNCVHRAYFVSFTNAVKGKVRLDLP